MPGGRLTHQDRQQIALGLADGLAYAEIARRLDRPTSTVTREVMRNGGPTAYRAEQAHRATTRRAHRRRKTVTAAPHDTPDAYGRDPETLRDYEELLADTLVQSGLPRMMSRILACLYTTDSRGLTATELVQRLQVSPASISKAVTFLESQDLVRRERLDNRRERYVVDADIWYQSLMASYRANERLMETTRQGVEILGPGSPAGARLAAVSRFLERVGDDLIHSAEQWRDVLYSERPEADR